METLRMLLRKRSKQWNIAIPDDWQNQWNMLKNKYNVCYNATDGNKFLSAGVSIGNTIGLNREWIVQLILKKDPNIHKTFLVTLGHERTHIKEDWKPKCKSPIWLIRKLMNRRFINWLNEVHADMGSSVEFPELTRKDIIHACWYKVSVKFDNNLRDKEDISHPSWARRIYYVQKYNFDEQLIRKIAADTGCEYAPLIDRAIDEISEIHLK